MAKEKVNLSSPWVIYYGKLESFFEQDPDVKVTLEEEEEYQPVIRLYVDNDRKADALQELLPNEKKFGNVKVPIIVIPSNNTFSKLDLLKVALEGNDAVVDIETVPTVFDDITYIIFEKKVVQYFADDLGDLHGINSTLYQDLAKEIFGECECSNIHFCTDSDW